MRRWANPTGENMVVGGLHWYIVVVGGRGCGWHSFLVGTLVLAGWGGQLCCFAGGVCASFGSADVGAVGFVESEEVFSEAVGGACVVVAFVPVVEVALLSVESR